MLAAAHEECGVADVVIRPVSRSRSVNSLIRATIHVWTGLTVSTTTCRRLRLRARRADRPRLVVAPAGPPALADATPAGRAVIFALAVLVFSTVWRTKVALEAVQAQLSRGRPTSTEQRAAQYPPRLHPARAESGELMRTRGLQRGDEVDAAEAIKKITAVDAVAWRLPINRRDHPTSFLERLPGRRVATSVRSSAIDPLLGVSDGEPDRSIRAAQSR